MSLRRTHGHNGHGIVGIAQAGSYSGGAIASPLLDNLESYWTLDEATGAIRSDSHGANHLTDNNNVVQIPGKIAQATDFTKASTNWLSHVHNASLDVSGNVDFTFAFWFDTGVQFATHAWITKYTGGGTNNDQFLIYYSSAPIFIVRAIDNTAVVLTSSVGAIAPGAWHFGICWRDGVNVYFQIDNGVVDSLPWAKDTKLSVVDFRIGKFGAATYSDSNIDEVGFWKRVLTAPERAQLWNGGAGLTYPF